MANKTVPSSRVHHSKFWPSSGQVLEWGAWVFNLELGTLKLGTNTKMGAKTRTASYDKLAPDTRYGSILVSKFINCLMHDGKKSVATRVVYDAMEQIKKRMPDADPVQVFTEAVNNVKPTLEVRSRRVGGANYQVPMQVKAKRAESLAIRWILAAIRAKKGRATPLKLAEELMAAYQRQGEAMAKREQTIKMAEANKAFSHFAW